MKSRTLPKRRTRSETDTSSSANGGGGGGGGLAALLADMSPTQPSSSSTAPDNNTNNNKHGGGGSDHDHLNLSMSWETSASAGGGLSLTRQEKTKKKPRRFEPTTSEDGNNAQTSSANNTIAGHDGNVSVHEQRRENQKQPHQHQQPEQEQESSTTQPQPRREVKKYQSFVRDAPSQQQNTSTNTTTAVPPPSRSPFDEKKTHHHHTTHAAHPHSQNSSATTTTKTAARKDDDDDAVPATTKASLQHSNNSNNNNKTHHRTQQKANDDDDDDDDDDNAADVVVPSTDAVLSGVHPRLASALKEKLNFSTLTYVQRAAWPPISAPTGDVVIRSETGSGKTVAYCLPLLHQLIVSTAGDAGMKIDRTCGTLMIIMAPTRELTEQCCAVVSKLVSRAAFIITGAIHGGDDRHHEKSRLRKGITVLVCTPGRLLDHLKLTNSFRYDLLRYMVMDEADRLLDMGFERSIQEIMSILPQPQKRVLVSATVTRAVERLTHFVLHPPITTVGQTEDIFEVPDTLVQKFVTVPAKHRLCALGALLWSKLLLPQPSSSSTGSSYHISQKSLINAKQKIVVFVSTSDAVEFLFLLFSRLSSPFVAATTTAQQQRSHIIAQAAASSSSHSGGHNRFSVKKKTEEANQHLQGGGRQNNIVEFDDDRDDDSDEDGTGGGGGEMMGSMDPRVARAAHAHKFFQQEKSLSDENAFLRGTDVFKLHGNMSQVDRQAVYDSFKKSSCAVLFCTDVAARGLDIPGVNLIVHYDPPVDEKCYVHRVGRTARVGSSGDSILFVMPHELEYVNYLGAATKKTSDVGAEDDKSSLQQNNYHHSNKNASDGADSADVGGVDPPQAKKMNMAEVSLDVILFNLSKMDRKAGPGRHWVHSAAFLQQAMCELTRNDQHLRQVSLFAYQSFIRAYAAVPRQVKRFFDQRQLHLGHIASSFANASTPAQLQRDLRGADIARREKTQARDATKIKRHGVHIDNTAEQYHSTLQRKAMFETKDRVDSGVAQTKVGATSSKAMTEFEA